MSARAAEPVSCPWCGYDVSWLAKGMVCPECGGRQSTADFAFAAQGEREAWRKMWLLVVMAPGCGLWVGLLIEQLWRAHPALIAAMPLVSWLVAVLAAICERWGRSRVAAHSVRQRQRWLFALVAGGALIVASGLMLTWLYMTAIVAALRMIHINMTQAAMTVLVGLFGMATGLLWALPLMRVRRL